MKKLWNLKIKHNFAGKIAEFLCRMYMRLRGYRIIAKNYRCGSGKNTPYGELDFIALKRKTIVFCEVKKRKRNSDFLHALSFKQQKRIMAGGMYFMRKHKKYKGYYMRFDVFFVRFPLHIRHIKNALYLERI